MLTFIALGANLGPDPSQNLAEAVRRLAEEPRVRPRRLAPVYRSAPLGPQDQPDYLNSVLQAETELPALALLDALQAIEAAMGRVRTVRWGPRIIDLDLLLYGSERIAHPRLVVPHPEMIRRRFVLQPLADLAPDLVIPGTSDTVRALLAALDDADELQTVAPATELP